jgi:Fur family ferric uptake transcriptional regulator
MSAIDSGRPRATKQRAAISDVLDRAGGFRSAQDIYDILRTEGSKVGLTTVYRTLQMLVTRSRHGPRPSAPGTASRR